MATVFIGPYIKNYNNLGISAQFQIITMMGQQDSLAWMRSSYYVTILYTTSFVIFFSYLFLAASFVTFEEGFMSTVHARGYPVDFE